MKPMKLADFFLFVDMAFFMVWEDDSVFLV